MAGRAVAGHTIERKMLSRAKIDVESGCEWREFLR